MQRHARVDVELGKKRARQWWDATLDDALGEYACEEDADAVADRERHFISESTDERLKAAIKKKVGLEPGANRFHALVDEMNLTHVTKKPKDIFDWKEEVKFMFCGVDVDEVAAMTVEDYQRMVDFRTLDAYRDPSKEWKKVNAPEQMQLEINF